MSFIKEHPVLSIIGLLILLAIIGAFLPNKQSEDLQEVNQTLDESKNIQNTLIPYTNQSCEDLKPKINESMKFFFYDDREWPNWPDFRPILKDGEELIMNKGCMNGQCSGYKDYHEYRRNEEGNILPNQDYKLTYYFNFILDECIYDGESWDVGIYKTCKISNTTCELDYI
ncbi:hypothetical protein HYT91_01960 [Candidatus Pacearchaeota archaeon]|nr:hypothetical protein [Candidatus Pacearchaeota archaeon]